MRGAGSRSSDDRTPARAAEPTDKRKKPAAKAGCDPRTSGKPDERRARLERLRRPLVACLLLLHLALGNVAASGWSVTFDEVLHLASGYAYWEFGDFRVQPTNGNLPQRWGTLPLWIAGVSYPSRDQEEWHRPTFLGMELGREMLFRLDNDPEVLLGASRAAMSLWSAAFGVLIYDWSRRLFGTAGGLFSLALYAVSPTFLAHGFLFTSDTAAAFCFLAATGSTWSALHKLTPGRLAAASASVGALAVAKMSAPLFAPVFGVLLVARIVVGRPWLTALAGRERLVRDRLAQLAWGAALGGALAGGAVFTIWAVHHFRYEAMVDAVAGRDDFSEPWPELLDGLGASRPWFEAAREGRLLPEAYLYGMAHTIRHARGRGAFLLGDYALEGWWYYFPYCFIAKSGTFELLAGLAAAAALGVGGARARPERRRRAAYYAIPLAALWCVYWGAAVTSNLNIGNRHLTPIYGPWYVYCGATAWLAISSLKLVRWLPVGLVAAAMLDAFWIHPHYLAYFNALVGGPSAGYRQLTNSAIDWGQDLPALKQWLLAEQARAPRVRLFHEYFGLADVEYYGLPGESFPFFHNQRLDPSHPLAFVPGRYAVSATHLASRAYWSAEDEETYRTVRTYITELSATHPWTPELPPEAYPPDVAEQWRAILVNLVSLQCKRLYHGLLFEKRPVASINYSILVYDVTAADLRKFLLEAGATP